VEEGFEVVEGAGSAAGTAGDEGGFEVEIGDREGFRLDDTIAFSPEPGGRGCSIFKEEELCLYIFHLAPAAGTFLLLDLELATDGFPGDIAGLAQGEGLGKRKGRRKGFLGRWLFRAFRWESPEGGKDGGEEVGGAGRVGLGDVGSWV
jgi:hypothetical protein